jgi:hypothetical protein
MELRHAGATVNNRISRAATDVAQRLLYVTGSCPSMGRLDSAVGHPYWSHYWSASHLHAVHDAP